MAFTSVIEETIEFAWWVEIFTALPKCTYYFGPFASLQDAEFAQLGYFEDLKQEGAKGLIIQIKQCQPSQLTIFEDEVNDSCCCSCTTNELVEV